MSLTILGTATRTTEALNDWLRANNCPPLAEHYRRAGEKYGVRWDIAIFQSVQETGWFKFGNDVKASQNNFAGIGATGGVPGDSFATPAEGIEAQIQNLALRAGVKIPKELILSPYVQKNYDFISKRGSVHWADLAGTWAGDKQYWVKIQDIVAKYEKWAESYVEPGVDRLDINRTDDGRPAISAMAQGNAKYTRLWKSREELDHFLARFPGVEVGVVATEKVIIPKAPDIDGTVDTGKPTPPPPPASKDALVVLDSGHSRGNPGARSKSKTVREEVLNEAAVAVMEGYLNGKGIGTKWVNPNPDNLVAIGKAGWGKPKVVVSFHHNSYKGSGNPYICVMVDPRADRKTKLLAQKVAYAIGDALDGLPQDAPVFGGTSGMKGVYEAELTVINTSMKDPDGNPPMHILVEAYFVNMFKDEASCLEASKRAGRATAEVVAAELGF